MNKIENADAFLNVVIKNKNRLVCSTDGTWRLEGRWEGMLMRLVRWLIPPLEDIRLLRITHTFNTFLDQLESKPVEFNSPDAVFNYGKCIDAGDRLTYYLKKRIPSYAMHGYLAASINRLQYRVTALKYRCEKVNGGEDPKQEIDSNRFDALKITAEKWKKCQPFPAPLTAEEVRFLEESCQFPLFVDQLLSDPNLQSSFFKWVIRYHNPVQAFIEFPATQNKLSASLLSSRVGLYNLLNVQGKDASERAQMGITKKDLTIPCRVQNNYQALPCSILNAASVITFKGGYSLSWKQIFEIFEKKNKDFGNLEAFPYGIDNWNSGQLGWWNEAAKKYECVDLTQDKWWLQIPSTQELTIEEARQRYSKRHLNGDSVNCDGNNWVYTLMMTRRSSTLELGGTHAYGEIAIPVDDDSGKRIYKTITLSRFPTVFPQSVLGLPKAVAGSFPAVVASPDLSIYILSRERFGPSYELTSDQGLAVMERVKEKIQLGRDRNLTYQMLTKNCLEFSEDIIRDVLGEMHVPQELSKTSFWESEPRGGIGTIFNLIKKTPVPIRKKVIDGIFYLAGSSATHTTQGHNGAKSTHSLYYNAPWNNQILKAPSVWMRKDDQSRTQSLFQTTNSFTEQSTPPLTPKWKKKITKIWNSKMSKVTFFSKVSKVASFSKVKATST